MAETQPFLGDQCVIQMETMAGGLVCGKMELKNTGLTQFITKVTQETRSPYVQKAQEDIAISQLVERAIEPFKTKCQNFYGIEGTWIKRLPWLDENLKVKDIYVDVCLERLNDRGGVIRRVRDILKGQSSEEKAPRTILLSGPGGSGKSTHVRKLAHDWATSYSEELSVFKGLVLYPLKDLKDDEDLSTVIKNKLQSFRQDDLHLPMERFIENVSEKLLIIMDGYDEMIEEKKHQVQEFLDDSLFFRSTTIVTIRDIGDKDFPKRFFMHIGMSKLEECRVNQVIEKSFSSNPPYAEEVKTFLKNNKEIAEGFQSSPLMVYSMCYVFQETKNRRILRSSELCFHVAFTLLKRKVGDACIEVTDEKIEEIILKLGELCLDILRHRKRAIKLSQFSTITEFVDLVLKCGLFQPRKLSEDLEEYEMLHPVFTESLAVRYYYENFQKLEPCLRRERMIEDLSANLETLTTRLVFCEEYGIRLAVRFQGIFWAYIRDSGCISDMVFKTINDSAAILKQSISVSPVGICMKDLKTMLSRDDKVNIMREYPNWKPENRHRHCLWFCNYFYRIWQEKSLFLRALTICMLWYCLTIGELHNHAGNKHPIFYLFNISFPLLGLVCVLWQYVYLSSNKRCSRFKFHSKRHCKVFYWCLFFLTMIVFGSYPFVIVNSLPSPFNILFIYGNLVSISIFITAYISLDYLLHLPVLNTTSNYDIVSLCKQFLMSIALIMNRLWNHLVLIWAFLAVVTFVLIAIGHSWYFLLEHLSLLWVLVLYTMISEVGVSLVKY